MTPFFAYVLVNMLLQFVLGLLIILHAWRGTDRHVPFIEFSSVASRPASRFWSGAYQWPGTYDPAVSDHWRQLAARTHLKLWTCALLHLAAATCGWMIVTWVTRLAAP